MFQSKLTIQLALLPFLLASCASSIAATEATVSADGMKITDSGKKLTVEIGGQLFTEYIYQDTPRPYFYPIMGPGGLPMTRNWPMKAVEGEERDHVHHKSLWFTHGDVNGTDFWSDGEKMGRIVHDKFTDIRVNNDSKGKIGIIKSQNNWVLPDGKIVCTDDRTHRITVLPNGFFIDFEIAIHASNGAVKFGDTKEGSMAIRIAETMRLSGKVGKGHIVNSAGVLDGKTWGKRAEWCEYHGPVQNQIVGVAIFDHPQNPRYPTWWHVRDYGLFAANPFGVHDFEKKPAGTGDLTIAAGKTATFRYRFYLHRGDEKEAAVAERYHEYITSESPK